MKDNNLIVEKDYLNPEKLNTESDLIARILSGAEKMDSRILLGPGDDGAVFKNEKTAISTDLSIENIHFRRNWISLEEIGFRAVMVAISDLAAMASSPFGVLVSLAIPEEDSRTVIEELKSGMQRALKKAGASLIGGDLSRSLGPIVIDVIVIGEIHELVTRQGVDPGNEIWVTGVLGGSSGAVKTWLTGGEPNKGLRDAFAKPPFRVEEAQWLVQNAGIKAMIDISDGLLRDLNHLAQASNVSIVLESKEVPLHPALHHSDALRLGISGGEDYELCFATKKGALDPFLTKFQEKFGLSMTRVGYVQEGSGVSVVGEGSTLLMKGISGFDHFSHQEP